MGVKYKLLFVTIIISLIWISSLIVDFDLHTWRVSFSSNYVEINNVTMPLQDTTVPGADVLPSKPAEIPTLSTSKRMPNPSHLSFLSSHLSASSIFSSSDASTSASVIKTSLPYTKKVPVSQNSPYILDFSGCKMKYYHPFDVEARPFYERVERPKCGVSFAKTKGNVLFLDKIGMARYFKISENDIVCELYGIKRGGNGQTDNRYQTYFVQELTQERYTSIHEFLELTCINKTEHIIYNDLFAFIQTKPEVEARRLKALKSLARQDKRREKFNVVFVGFDSVSHRNFLRQLPKTYKYLKQNYDPLEFQGYTKIGLNTFPCLLPLFAGKSREELNIGDGPYDNVPFIWKNFSSLGYRTLFAEDYPGIAIFHYLKEGFYFQPTDYYMRPFYLAADNSYMTKYGKENCFNSRNTETVLLQWVKDFMTHFKDDPVFSFSFMTATTHSYLNSAGYVDDPMYEYFQWYRTHPSRNNTFLIFFSDHGLRWGRFRETDMGSQEDSLPFFLMLVPPSFKQKYPYFYMNLRLNQKRLVTMYDVHEMLKDILSFTGVDQNINPSVFQRGISLFNEIPKGRTCDDAGIGVEYCVCQESVPIDVRSALAARAALRVVNAINNITSVERTKCEILKLQNVVSVRHYIVNRRTQQKLKKVSSFKIKLHTLPGGGLFESAVQCDDDSDIETCTTYGEIQRINKYGKQGDCITEDSSLRNYCYCSNNPT